MIKKIPYDQYARETLQQLPRGAFLSVKAGDKINTMTIGWGAIGYIWRQPIMIVAVRYSRYTYNLIEEAHDFSVSIPLQKTMKTSLAGAGSKSGRDIDKFAAFNLTPQKGEKIDSPYIEECDLIYECSILYKQPLDPEMLAPSIREKFYSDEDYHVLYFGNIVSCYRNS